MWTNEEYAQMVQALREALGRPDPVAFDRFRAAFPGALYVSRDDELELRTYGTIAGLTAVARVRMLSPGGDVVPNTWRQASSSDGTAATLRVQVGEGFLLALTVENEGAAPMRGQHYAAVRVFHGGPITPERVQVLVEGFITTETLLAWPAPTSAAGPDPRRALVVTAVAAPAAGAEIVATIPTARRARFQSLYFDLVTAVAAANRQVGLIVDDGADILWRELAADVQTASLTRHYVAAPIGFEHALRVDLAQLSIPVELWLRGGWRIRTTTAAIQAADQYSAIRLVTEEQLDV